MKELIKLSRWIVVVGAVLVGYAGVTGGDLLGMVLGSSLKNMADIVVGIAGLTVGYDMLMGKKK